MVVSAGSLSAETALLRCARGRPDARAIYAPPEEWGRLATLASAHEILPLTYWNLKHLQSDLSAGTREELRRGFEANVLGNLALSAELRAILALFMQKNVHIVPFKGPLCALSLYGALSLRTFGDLDVLVRPRDLPRAKELLLSMGYRIDERYFPASKHLVFVRDDYEFVVELHWAFFEPGMACHIDLPRLWSRLKTIDFLGTPASSLHPEDEILILAIHGANHGWPILKWVCDIAEFTRVHQDLDWGSVLRDAGRAGCLRMLLIGLTVAHKLLGAEIPAACESAASDPLIESLADEVCAKLFAEHTERPSGRQAAIAAAGAHRAQMDFRERRWDRMALLFCYVRDRLKPNEADREHWRMARFLPFFCVLLRPIRLLQVYGWKSAAATARMLLTALFRPSLQN